MDEVKKTLEMRQAVILFVRERLDRILQDSQERESRGDWSDEQVGFCEKYIDQLLADLNFLDNNT